MFLNADLDLRAPPPTPSMYVPRLVDLLSLPEDLRFVVEGLLDDVIDEEVAQGRNPAAFAGALIYAVWSRFRGVSLNQDEVAEAAGVTKTTIRQIRDAVIEHLDEKNRNLLVLVRRHLPETSSDIDRLIQMDVTPKYGDRMWGGDPSAASPSQTASDGSDTLSSASPSESGKATYTPASQGVSSTPGD